jgi:hypothetical protein
MFLPEKFQDSAYFTTANLRALFQCSDMTLWRWRQCGYLGAPAKINGRNFYPRQSVLALGDLLEKQIENPDTAA